MLSLVAVLLVVTAAVQSTRMGSEFLPQLDEHDIALHALRMQFQQPTSKEDIVVECPPPQDWSSHL